MNDWILLFKVIGCAFILVFPIIWSSEKITDLNLPEWLNTFCGCGFGIIIIILIFIIVKYTKWFI